MIIIAPARDACPLLTAKPGERLVGSVCKLVVSAHLQCGLEPRNLDGTNCSAVSNLLVSEN